MATRVHHVVCATEEPEILTDFLREVVGLELGVKIETDGRGTSTLFDWPDTERIETRMLGAGTAGLVDVLGVPPALRGQGHSGCIAVAFSAPDLDERVAACRARGLEVHGPVHVESSGIVFREAAVEVAGVRVSFLQFVEPAGG